MRKILYICLGMAIGVNVFVRATDESAFSDTIPSILQNEIAEKSENVSPDPIQHAEEPLSLQTEIAEKPVDIVNPTFNELQREKTTTLDAIILEVRASYFRPFSKTFRKFVHGGGVNYTLETTIPVWKRWNIWAGVDYFSKGGSMIGIHRSVHITMVPITLGLKYIYWFNRFYALYGGGAGKYYFVETINRVFPMHKTTYRDGWGSVFEVGNLICFNHFVIDIFSSWSFKTMHGLHHLPPNATSSSMKLGGWNIGAGLSYKF